MNYEPHELSTLDRAVRQSGLRSHHFKQRREGGWWVVLAVVLLTLVAFIVTERPL